MYCEEYMLRALEFAKESAELGEVPVGAVIVRGGEIIATGMNLRETGRNALLHAETSAINEACRKLGGWRLTGCDLYVTLEPCPMCAGAIVNSRIENVYFGSYDINGGAVASVVKLFDVGGLYRPVYEGGHLQEECSALLSDFFRTLREKNKKQKRENMSVSIIVAKGNNNEIGGDNKLLWRISADLKFFKSVTMGKAIIMGRKTWESLPKALPGRKNIVITRNPDYIAEGAVVVNSIDDAIAEADTDEVFIIGGEAIYNAFLDRADRLYITEVDVDRPEADAFFPVFDAAAYTKEVLGEAVENSISFRHILYTRKA